MDKNKWFLNGGRGSGRSIRLLCETYENKIAELKKENENLASIAEHQQSSNMKRYFEIVELKKSCDETQELLDKQIEATYKLDKENAELKERLKKLTIHDTNTVLKGLEMGVLKNSHRDRANNLQDQLTKAKEIINDCVCELQNILFYKMRNKERIASTLDKAEQFLNSEVEK